MTGADIFQSYRDSQRRTIYRLVSEMVLTGSYNHGLYHSVQFGMTENQKDLLDCLLREALKAHKSAFDTRT